jgi:D-sedoheptulose 7-phosphate isomerase
VSSVLKTDLLRPLDLENMISDELDEHRKVFFDTASKLTQPIGEMLALWERSIRGGHKILLFGNGGSAADAQHIAAEMVIRYKSDRRPIRAISLTTDSSTLTACGNDLGYDALFARQVEALGQEGDVAVGISTSGNSRNVLNGLKQARDMGIATTGLTGGDGGAMKQLCDSLVIVPSSVTARIQEMHIMIGHILCKTLENKLGLVAR